jgi:rRNA processing protein Gar1
MNAVTRITPHVRQLNAPDELKDLPGWLMWRLEEDEQGKARKIPFYASGERRTGQNGSSTDRAKLTTFEAARTAAARRGFDGVGLALMPEFNVTVLDFDHCVSGDQVDAEVLAMVSDTYAELSPSGTGVHAVYRGRIANAKSPSTPSRWGFETFSDKGFVTWTGNVLELVELVGTDNTIAPLNDHVVAEVNRRFGHRDTEREPGSTERLGLTLERCRAAIAELDADLGFEHWLRVGMALHHELGPEGFQLWDEWSSRGAKYRGSDNLMTHWRTFGRHRPGHEPVTMRSIGKMVGRPLDAGPATAEEFDALVDQGQGQGASPEPGAAPKAPRFEFQPVHTFASATASAWIVKGVLPQAGLAVVYGASGSGKSFAVLDMVLAIARGTTWRDRKVRQGRVAYIAAEGADGFRKRLAAYAQHQGVDLSTVPMAVLNGAPNLLEVKDAADLVVGVQAWGGAEVIVVDTLAQTMPGGNENAGEDMGRALGHCRRIHEKTGALVILIHHSGKDQAKGARGWSGLRAAADAEIEVLRDDATGQRSLRLSKNKDGEDGLQWGFELQIVQLGVDEDLDPITSCVVAEAELKVGAVARKMGPVETVVHAVVMEMAQAQSSGIELEAVIKESIRRLAEPDQGKRDTRKQHVKRALESLTRGDSAPFWIEDDCLTVV